jgi:signal transduction histidine kinase
MGLRAAAGSPWLRGALWLLGPAIAAWLIATSPAGTGLDEVNGALLGSAFVASGLVAWRRRPGNRLGPLMAGIGFYTLAAELAVRSSSSVVFTAGIVLGDAWVVLFVLFLLCFPDGRLASRLDRLVVAAFFVAMVPIELVWLLFYVSEEGPANALLVWPDDSVGDAIDAVSTTLAVGAALTLSVTLARRWLEGSAPLRRALVPILIGAAAMLVSTLAVAFRKTIGPPPVALQHAVGLVTIAVPLAVLAVLLRARLARSAVGEIFVGLGAGGLRAALARALGDPGLTLAFWVPEHGGYVDEDGHPVELPSAGSGRTATVVERGGERVAALVHDAALADERELLAAVSAAAGIALDNERLQADLRAGLEDLRASRARIVAAGDVERRRLERDLHDGAQQRLVSLSMMLRLLAARMPGDSEATDLLEQARGELAASHSELRELAQGIHPAVLDHGLEVALGSLATRAPVRVDLSVRVDRRLPPPVEAAAYFLVSEALTNTAKYAGACTARVDVEWRAGRLVVEVADDGAGGADPARGSGLRGLADRVEALGGGVEVWSEPSRGTRIRAEIPCA